VLCGRTGCSAFQAYRGGHDDEEAYAGVLFEHGGAARLVVGSSWWRHEDGAAVTIGLEVDDEPLSTTLGQAHATVVAVTLTPDDVRRLAKGRILRVSTLGARYRLPLDGSAAGMAQAMRAIKERAARGAVPPVPERRPVEVAP